MPTCCGESIESWTVSENQAYADLIVQIEADNAVQSGYTFYGRRVNGDGSDNRERLPEAWDARYIAGGVFQQALLQVWRDPGIVSPWACGGPVPAISQGRIWAFDEQENAAVVSDEDASDGITPVVPRAASQIRVNSTEGLVTGSDFGFITLDLRLAPEVTDPLFGRVNQAHVSTIHKAQGRFAGLMTAWPTGTVGNYMPDPVSRPFPSLGLQYSSPGFSCPDGFSVMTPLPSGDATLEVTAAAGPVHLRYQPRLVDNFNATRPVTGQIPAGAGVWLGPPAEASKTSNFSVWSQPYNTAVVWGYHEVTAPFAPFDVQFFVPGGTVNQSRKITVSYAGDLFPRLELKSVSCEEGTTQVLLDPYNGRTIRVRGPQGVPLHLKYLLESFDTGATLLTCNLPGGRGVWLGPPPESGKSANIQPNVLFDTSAVWGMHEITAPFSYFTIQFFTGSAAVTYRVEYAGAVQ